MVFINNEKGQVLGIVLVLLACATILGLSLAAVSVQAARNEQINYASIRAKLAADSGIELAREKLFTNPTWTTGSDIVGPIDPSEPEVRISSVKVTQDNIYVNPDSSVTYIVSVTVTGTCKNQSNTAEATYMLTYFPQVF